jgi:RIO-like serine/threonine protein kinase
MNKFRTDNNNQFNFIHGDLSDTNILVREGDDGKYTISGWFICN